MFVVAEEEEVTVGDVDDVNLAKDIGFWIFSIFINSKKLVIIILSVVVFVSSSSGNKIVIVVVVVTVIVTVTVKIVVDVIQRA